MDYAHWGLDRPPFAGAASDRCFYEGQAQTEALSRLRFLATQRRRGGLLSGARGSGKSQLLKLFGEHCRLAGRETAHVAAAGLSPRELYWQVASQLDAAPSASDDLPRLNRRLADYARAADQREAHAVLMIDDADQAGPDLLGHLLRLIGIASSRPWLTAIVAANQEHLGRLGAGLVDKLDLHIALDPWDPEETAGYVHFSLFNAGSSIPLFDEHALTLLHELSGGIPRQVIRLADHALLAAAAEGCEKVTASHVEASLGELRWTTSPS